MADRHASAPLADLLADRLARLPVFYEYPHVLGCFGGDEAAFLDAWIAGQIPPAVQQVCRRSLPAGFLQELLLQRIARQLGQLLLIAQHRAENPHL
jgi:hypothetical protein